MKLSAADMAKRQQEMLEAAFSLFSKRNIDSVTMAEIAALTGYTQRSLNRYFISKSALVVEVAAWSWEKFMAQYRRRRRGRGETTAAEEYEFFLDSFLVLYRRHRDLLRFNQFFNVYVRAEQVGADTLKPYRDMLDALRGQFSLLYRKGREDGTLRADAGEEEMFSASLHLMLAAVTRYAVGLVYEGGASTESELTLLKEMLLRQYTVPAE